MLRIQSYGIYIYIRTPSRISLALYILNIMCHMSCFWYCLVLAGLGLVIYRASNIYFDHQGSPKPKNVGIYSLPVYANQWPLGSDFLARSLRASKESRYMEFCLDNFRRLGFTFQQLVGWNATILTIEPANLEFMLSANARDWGVGIRRTIFLPLLGDGLFTQEGDKWKHSRDVLRPQFYHRHYENLEIFRPHVENLLQAIGDIRGVVDLEPLFFRLTLDVTTQFLFGESVYSQRTSKNAKANDFEVAFDLAQSVSIKRLKFQKLHWLVGGKRFRKACDTVHQFADQIIDNMGYGNSFDNENGHRGRSFLEAIASEYPERDALKGQVTNVLAAGRDSTACLLSWTIFHIIRHPIVMGKLRSEIEALDEAENPLCRSDLLKLEYLQNVIKEALRLHPPIPLVSRTALRDTTLPVGGSPYQQSPIFVPKGTSVLYSAYSLHRRPDIYGTDAEVFRPERWEEERLQSREATHRGWTYMPFGGGPRSCLGMDFSLTETAYTIIRILQRYPVLDLPTGEEILPSGQERQTTTIVLRPADGCKVELWGR
ncbi:cytochrome P450 alkane hydroxylase [Biscogniauxia marginata]|nr:cytochrome P450 alkane hydroxylase [Biscogniauxia marginata]